MISIYTRIPTCAPYSTTIVESCTTILVRVDRTIANGCTNSKLGTLAIVIFIKRNISNDPVIRIVFVSTYSDSILRL